MLKIFPERDRSDAIDFCKRFLSNDKPRYVLGRNEYAVSIANEVDIVGFIDDFTNEATFLGKPVIKTKDIPPNSLVVSAVVYGRPLIALNKLKNRNLPCLDYFAFGKYSELNIKEPDALKGFAEDFQKNLAKYRWIYERLNDKKSKDLMSKLLNFRISRDLIYMEGIPFAQEFQYFEDFLNLQPGEVFIDVGGYDGQTSKDFIKRCPEYKSVHFFEPDPANFSEAKKNLSGYKSIFFYPIGLADKNDILRMDSGSGSSSKICEIGDIKINVDTIDNLIAEQITFIKMDIEGAEGLALKGTENHILQDHPKLAVCCYHKFDDFWRLPSQILSVRDDYNVYLRHYTEGITETVMFFIPKQHFDPSQG